MKCKNVERLFNAIIEENLTPYIYSHKNYIHLDNTFDEHIQKIETRKF
ncbi:MAG: hypothetical protein RSD47_06270 [Romboutsia sp.]